MDFFSMCLSPVYIDNPNRGKFVGSLDSKLKDTHSAKIAVPCGQCSECIRARQMSLVQRVQNEALSNELFFCTLTYNDDMIPVTEVNGFRIKYAAVDDVQKMFKRLRKDNAFGVPFRYFCVSELGSKYGRPHFHILFLIDRKFCKDFLECQSLQELMFSRVLKYWSRNTGTNRNPVYVPCCTFIRKWCGRVLKSTYDLHWLNPSLSSDGVSDVAFYVLKYMLKPSDRAVRLQRALKLNLSPEDYRSTWNLVRPRYLQSKGFGLNAYKVSGKWVVDPTLVKYVKDGISTCISNGSEYPSYFNPVTGKSFPLSPYFKSKFLTVPDALTFHDRSDHPYGDGRFDDPHFGDSHAIQEADKFQLLLSRVNSRNDVFDFDF